MSTAGSRSDFKESRIGALNNYFSRTMQKYNVPGLSLTISKNGRKIFSRGYGHRNLQNLKPATENTLYGVGSVTKSFTALAIMQLEEDGLLRVEDRVEEHCDSFHVDADSGRTTISHLLYHGSGIPSLNVAEVLLFGGTGTDTSFIPITNYGDFFDLINAATDQRHSSPGKKHLYWNEGYTILGKIIEDVTGKSYEDYVKERILNPLGMKRSTFLRKLAESDDDCSVPYYRDRDDDLKPSLIPDDPLVLAPGGLLSSSLELSKYLGLWTGNNENENAILSRKRLDELIKPRIKSSFTGLSRDTRYGFGWMISDNFLGEKLVMHSGSVAASSGFVGFLPEQRISVSIGANTSDAPTTRLGMIALALAMDGVNVEELQFLKTERVRERMKGEYTDYRGYTRVVIADGPDGLLNMSIDSDEYHIILPVIIEDGEIYTVTNDMRYDLEVRFRNESGVEIYFERHRFVKK